MKSFVPAYIGKLKLNLRELSPSPRISFIE